MIRFTPIALDECPAPLQEAVQKKRATAEKMGYTFSILSIARRDSTPYRDKTEVVQTYRVFLCYENIIAILQFSKDHVFGDGITENSLLWGDVIEILRHPPEGSGLDQIRQIILASDAAWQLN